MKQTPWRAALARTRQKAFGRIVTLLGASEISADLWDDLEAHLVQADVGIDLTQRLIQRLDHRKRDEGWTRGDQLLQGLEEELLAILDGPQAVQAPTGDSPRVIMLVGVNGSGKTTTVARLANRYQKEGSSVLLAASDTYRAAATEQLEAWGERLKVDVISAEPGSDPGAVVYNACQTASARATNVVLVDTSGRMHTSHNLMAELEKLARVAGKVVSGAPHETLLVLDATTGQNALTQAREFGERIGLTGIVLAKLDSSAKGGIAFAVVEATGTPISYVGIGERLQDLAVFDPPSFVSGLLAEVDRQPTH